MIACILIYLLFVVSISASNDEYFAEGWKPVSRSFVFNQMSNSYTGTRHASGWKPSRGIDYTNIDSVKEDTIRIINPKQGKGITSEKNFNTQPSEVSVVLQTDNLGQSAVKEVNQSHGFENGNINYKTKFNQRTSKRIWDISSSEEFPDNSLSTLDQSLKKAQTENSINVKNITYSNYEVTEPSNVQELEQVTYKHNNVYTNKFVHLLSKYNIKGDDKLNNYEKSTVHRKKPLYQSVVSAVPLRPFRYNSLDHLPVDPLLAVLLSNYGYYLNGFYGLQNNYKNLYGYSASNNIYNNKPFGLYKIYSDTDSSN